MSSPRKVYVEVTTLCNLQCSMCVKHAQGSCIPEGHMAMEVFQSLVTGLQSVEFLVLNGIGEPLLHPDLVKMVQLARQHMPEKGIIGFQSNGLLVNDSNAEKLLVSGLDTICLSLDNLEDTRAELRGKEHSLSPVINAVKSLDRARNKSARPFQLGIEVVISRDNMHQLNDLVAWAGTHRVDYILVSHLYSYDGRGQESILFSPNTRSAVQLYEKWQKRAQELGVNLENLPNVRLHYARDHQDQTLLEIGEWMRKEATASGIRMHLQNLFTFDAELAQTLGQIFEQAECAAKSLGIALHLPPKLAYEEKERHCFFMDEQASFVDQYGNISPCHFLWHTFRCQVNNEPLLVEHHTYGNVQDESLEEIWQKKSYKEFRQEATQSSYSTCWSCTPGPCANLLKQNAMDIRDCHGSQVPCGHCMWSIGWTRCL
ncbi:radical SAM/SPASM family putative metalloenzyme maturase [Desulfogranum japonicum]|uniref:radical SAM/SPASM family putative metalloenzyme maturase n=1 Tax=Desulfogranum japonicum TaxID=231447 RepID=UPI000491618B|nr:radical SAM/SPASM family putative metalloenzyme maturase [Desulfogranum japonicum]